MNAHAHKMDANHELKSFVPHNRKTSRLYRFRVHNKNDLQTLEVFAAAWLSRMLATALNAFKGHWWLQKMLLRLAWVLALLRNMMSYVSLLSLPSLSAFPGSGYVVFAWDDFCLNDRTHTKYFWGW